RVELVEPRREFAQEGIDQRPHRAQRVISWDTPLHRYVAPHRLLVFPLVAAHAHLRDGSRHAHRSRTLMSTRYLKSGFSAACWGRSARKGERETRIAAGIEAPEKRQPEPKLEGLKLTTAAALLGSRSTEHP